MTNTSMTDHALHDLSRLGSTVVTVWAHPDDETYLSGGLSAALRDRGVRLVCVTATRGEAGGPASDPAAAMRLAQVRTGELEHALELLGVAEHVWLNHPDGGLAAVPPEIGVAQVVGVLDEVRPDTVVTFGPEGHTGHSDHRTVSRWVDQAVRRSVANPRVLQVAVTADQLAIDPSLNDDFGVFAEGRPRVCPPEQLALRLELGPHLLRRKVEALVRQPSQTEGLIGAVGLERFAAWVAIESFAEPESHRHSA